MNPFLRLEFESMMTGKSVMECFNDDLVRQSEYMKDKKIVHTVIPLSSEEQEALISTFSKIGDMDDYEKRNKIWNDEFKPFIKKKLS